MDVSGNVKFSGLIMPNNLPETVGQVMVSSGAKLVPS